MDKVPPKFAKLRESFMDRLVPDAGRTSLSSYCAFPRDVSFAGKEDNEEVILMLRQHPASFWVQYLMIFVFILLPFVFLFGLVGLGFEDASTGAISIAGFIIFWMLAFTISVDTFLKWFYSVNIVTDQRVVDVDFHNVLFHKVSEATLVRIEDVTHTVDGLLGSLFDYGSVYIQTAGTRTEIEFQNVPRPRDVQDVLFDLIELKQKGEI
jgi:membrane protein YdbS with pleckstrin-like domain